MTEKDYLLRNGFTILHEDDTRIAYCYHSQDNLVVYKREEDKYIVEMTSLIVDFKFLLHIYQIDESEYKKHKKIENRQSVINKVLDERKA